MSPPPLSRASTTTRRTFFVRASLREPVEHALRHGVRLVEAEVDGAAAVERRQPDRLLLPAQPDRLRLARAQQRVDDAPLREGGRRHRLAARRYVPPANANAARPPSVSPRPFSTSSVTTSSGRIRSAPVSLSCGTSGRTASATCADGHAVDRLEPLAHERRIGRVDDPHARPGTRRGGPGTRAAAARAGGRRRRRCGRSRSPSA